MYSLAYGMMVQVLRQLGYSGEFHADVTPHAALKEGGRVVLVVRNGSVISCHIFDKHGQKLYHDAEAQRLLPTFGILNWKLAPAHSTRTANPVTPPVAPSLQRNMNPITPPTMPTVKSDANPITPPMMPTVRPVEPVARERRFVPHRLQVSESQVRSWSALERSVFFLADGVRSTEQIATLLSRPPATIEQIINQLEASGAIRQS